MTTKPLPVAMITGASRGIGAAITQRLSGNHRLALLARDATPLTTTNPNVFSRSVDVTHEKALEDFINDADQHFGQLDVLIANAGTEYAGLLEDTDMSQAHDLFEVNFFAVLNACKLVIPKMKATGGHIIIIGSETSFRGIPTKGVYSASKFALRGLADSLRIELHRYGIKVSLLHPGFVNTQLHDHSINWLKEKGYASPRVRHSPKQLANLIAQLLEHPTANRMPGWRAQVNRYLSLVAPGWVDRRAQKVFRANGYEFY